MPMSILHLNLGQDLPQGFIIKPFLLFCKCHLSCNTLRINCNDDALASGISLLRGLQNEGLLADVFTETLSHPDFKSCLISSIAPIPPPTVSGIKTSFAVLSTTSRIIFLFSCDAVISRNTSSSAPCSS